jgi:hypothetical protein
MPWAGWMAKRKGVTRVAVLILASNYCLVWSFIEVLAPPAKERR